MKSRCDRMRSIFLLDFVVSSKYMMKAMAAGNDDDDCATQFIVCTIFADGFVRCRALTIVSRQIRWMGQSVCLSWDENGFTQNEIYNLQPN